MPEHEDVNKDRAESAPADQPDKPVDDNELKLENDPSVTGQTLPAFTPPGVDASGLYRGPLADEAGEGRLGEDASDGASSPSSPKLAIKAEAREEGDTRPETEVVAEKVEEESQENN